MPHRNQQQPQPDLANFEPERRNARNRLTDKISDAVQWILLAIVASSAGMLLSVKSEQDKMGVTVLQLSTSIATMQQKLEIMSDTKVNKSDWTLDKAAIYERLRSVEADQKIMAERYSDRITPSRVVR